jgi:uncharacterized protein YdeI (YjbR/CyaY-like superfamily)
LPEVRNPKFFATPAAWRSWLAKNYDKKTELWVGFHKKGTGRRSITWPESVDEALCFGWIDGIRKSIDGDSYAIRFTPRKKGSNWSEVNLRRVPELITEERMHSAGLSAYEGRDPRKSGLYSFEQRQNAKLSPSEMKKFKANAKAWKFFEAQPPGYRRLMIFRTVSAKRDETRERRLKELIDESAAGRRIDLSRSRASMK